MTNSMRVVLLLFAAVSSFAADFFDFSGDSTEVNLNEGQEYTKLSGNARVVSDTSELTADDIEIYGEGFRYVYCQGNVGFFDTEYNILLSSSSLFYDRDSSRSLAKGSVLLEDRENDLFARAVSLEISSEGNRIVMQAGVRIVQEDFVIRSELAIYDRESQELYLSGFPRVIQGEDVYEALNITLNLASEEVELRGRVSGSIRPADDGPAAAPEEPAVPAVPAEPVEESAQ